MIKASNVFKIFQIPVYVFFKLKKLNVIKFPLTFESATVCPIGFCYILLLSKSNNYFWKKKKVLTLKHLAAVILWFLLQLEVILCTFLKKQELELKNNK